uniref:Uncharacterized protein n=1 Tax=Arundo donax TaxID=35708 RepID=A0A0A8XZP1_ARUDO
MKMEVTQNNKGGLSVLL